MPVPTSNLRSDATDLDIALFQEIETTLYTAVIADSLDELGYRNQAMNPEMRPITPCTAFAGWARTIACVDVYHVPEDPYAMEIEALDSIRDGEVVVVSTGGSRRNAPWGELLSTAARARGARGAVIEGLVRDVRKIEELQFPVFAVGVKPVDSRGRGIVLGYNSPVECAGVLVTPGDLVVADFDGVVVIPQEAIHETVRMASDKAGRENESRRELLKGAFLRDVFEKYGVL